MKPSRGFTLVELLMVLVVVAVAAAGIAGLQGNMFGLQSSVSRLQVQTQLQTECAEQILAVRKYHADGFYTITAGAAYGTNACGGITALSGYTVPTVTITDPYTGAACPATSACKLVVITQTGASPLSLLLVNT